MDHAFAAEPITELVDERRHLLDVARWLLGDGSEAEQIVDDTYARWYELSEAERADIPEPLPWLVKVLGGMSVSRLILLDREIRAAASGQPDGMPPIVWPVHDDAPGRHSGQVLLSALDSLPPTARAAFVLNDVFGMAPGTVAGIVGRSELECDHLADSARRFLRRKRSYPTSAEQHDAMTRTVLKACLTEDAALLASLLSPDATAFFDGGGKIRTLAEPVHGSGPVAHRLSTLLARQPGTKLTAQSVNGRCGLVVRYGNLVVGVISFDVHHDRIVHVWVVLNPDKLRSWNRTPHAPGAS
ncbi:RNA polymerase subunit sigma [Streptomyces sp. NPDC026673]|uniref:RNA polymerase subunit sigma n=1 Tax=Streptomyces sp. NPDC026673 TaxID=3155724 RepID=UPI0033EEEE5E